MSSLLAGVTGPRLSGSAIPMTSDRSLSSNSTKRYKKVRRCSPFSSIRRRRGRPINDAMGSAPGEGHKVAALREKLGANYLSGIFRTPDDLASQVAAAVSAHSLSRFIVDRVLGKTSAVLADVDPFAQGAEVNDFNPDGDQATHQAIRRVTRACSCDR